MSIDISMEHGNSLSVSFLGEVHTCAREALEKTVWLAMTEMYLSPAEYINYQQIKVTSHKITRMGEQRKEEEIG